MNMLVNYMHKACAPDTAVLSCRPAEVGRGGGDGDALHTTLVAAPRLGGGGGEVRVHE